MIMTKNINQPAWMKNILIESFVQVIHYEKDKTKIDEKIFFLYLNTFFVHF